MLALRRDVGPARVFLGEAEKTPWLVWFRPCIASRVNRFALQFRATALGCSLSPCHLQSIDMIMIYARYSPVFTLLLEMDQSKYNLEFPSIIFRRSARG